MTAKRDAASADASARLRIKSDLSTSLIVEAGAGAGKTTSLVDRMLSLIGKGYSTIETIVAVTFTNKAAAELAEKFQENLEAAIKSKTWSDEEKRRLAAALTHLELANICTIHAFCSQLIRERPVESEVDPDFKIVEEKEDATAATDFWFKAIDNDPKIAEQLNELGISPDDCLQAYLAVYANPDVEFTDISAPKPDFSAIIIALQDFFAEMSMGMAQGIPINERDGLQKILFQAQACITSADIDEPQVIAALTQLDRNSYPLSMKRCWGNVENGRCFQEKMHAFRDNMIRPAIKAWWAYAYHRVLPLLCSVARDYRQDRRNQGELDFADLLLATAKLLRSSAEVRSYFSERFSHYLIDEFQDTDPIQAEIFMLLASPESEEEDWRKCQLKPGSLFIVGDPKQSIYRFRRADISIYEEVKNIIRSSGGDVIRLTMNFRSLETVIDFINPVFSEIFPEKSSERQARWVAMDKSKSVLSPALSGVFSFNTTESGDRDQRYQDDAQHIGAWISSALQSGLPIQRITADHGTVLEPCRPSDFMILTPRKAELDYYARNLADYGIPTTLLGAGSFKNDGLLHEALKVLQAAAQPEDPIVVLAALRSPFLSISDQDLYDYKQAGGSWHPERMDVNLGNTGIALNRIRSFHEKIRNLPPGQAARQILDELGAMELSAFNLINDGSPASFAQAIHLLRRLETDKDLTFGEALAALKELAESDLDAAGIHTGARDSVLIANLHKAKGMEASIVFLAAPHKPKPRTVSIHVQRSANGNIGYLNIGRTDTYNNLTVLAAPGIWETLEPIETAFLADEDDRKAYVGATRAKQILVISCCSWTDGNDIWKPLTNRLDKTLPLPELAAVEMIEQASFTKAQVKIGFNEFQHAMSSTAKKIEEASKQSYADLSVSSLETARHSPPAGRGSRWGTLVHRVLELMAKTNTDEALMQVQSEFISDRFEDDDWYRLKNLLAKFSSSELWSRAKAAPILLAEVPFLVNIGEDKLEYVSGVIDLVFKDENGWVVVDYKTEEAFGSRLKNIAKMYFPEQIKYAECWSACMNEPVAEAYLFFVSTGDLVAAPLPHSN